MALKVLKQESKIEMSQISNEIPDATDSSGYAIKIILIGDGGCGKTSLVNQFVHRQFSSIYKTTIGVDITPYTVSIKETGEPVRFILWDMSGQSHFEKFRKRFYVGSSGALVLYDLTNARSYLNVPTWVKEAHSNCKDIPIVAVGNKSDLVDLKIPQTKSPIDDMSLVITSAKDNKNVDEAFFTLFEMIIKKPIERIRDETAETKHISYENKEET